MRCFLFAGLLAVGTRALAPVPIQWAGLPARTFVMAPRASPKRTFVPNRAIGQPQGLAIWDQLGRMPTSQSPQFTVKPDKTISWAATGCCIEAGGDEPGNTVFVNQCHGGPTQLWDVLPLGKHRNHFIQLQGTLKCLQVNDEAGAINGAPVELQECSNTAAQSWSFGESNHALVGNSSQQYVFSSMRHVMVSAISMSALGVLSLGAWLLRKQEKRQGGFSQGSDLLNADQGCICLTTPLGGRQGNTSLTPSFFTGMIPAVMLLTPNTDGDTHIKNQNIELLSLPTPELMDAIIASDSSTVVSREALAQIIESIGKWAAGAESGTFDERVDMQRKVLRTYGALKRRGLLRGFGYCANALFPWSDKNFDEDSFKRITDLEKDPFSEDAGWLKIPFYPGFTPACLGYLGLKAPLSYLESTSNPFLDEPTSNPFLDAISTQYASISNTIDMIALGFAGLVLLEKFATEGALYETAVRSVQPQYQDIAIKHEAGRLLVAYLTGSPLQDCEMNAAAALMAGRFKNVKSGAVVIDPDFLEVSESGTAETALIKRYTIVMAAGVAAESLVNGQAKFGIEDIASMTKFLTGIQIRKLTEKMEKQIQQPGNDFLVVDSEEMEFSFLDPTMQFRWGVAQAFSLLKEHRFAYDALVEAIKSGASIGGAIVAIEDALDRNGELPAKARVDTATSSTTEASTEFRIRIRTTEAPTQPSGTGEKVEKVEKVVQRVQKTREDLENESADLDAMIEENTEKAKLANLRLERMRLDDTQEIDKKIAESEQRIQFLTLEREKNDLQRQVAELQAERSRLEKETSDSQEGLRR